jgi:carbohydrate-selective porin OprB
LWGRQNGAGDNSVAFGVSFDQEVGTYLRPFGRYGFQFGGGQSALEAFSMGVGIRSTFQARPKDETGFAFGWTRVANGHAEDLIELYHRLYITDHLSLSPIAQLALNLAGNSESGRHQGVFLGGLRTQVDY